MSGATTAGLIRIMAVVLLLPAYVGVAQGQVPVRTPTARESIPDPRVRPMTRPQQAALGTLNKTGEVRMEKIDLRVDMGNPAATADPYATVKKVLEQNGIPVNSLTMSNQTFLRNGGVMKCYHVVYPEAEKSNTICE